MIILIRNKRSTADSARYRATPERLGEDEAEVRGEGAAAADGGGLHQQHDHHEDQGDPQVRRKFRLSFVYEFK